MELKPCPFCGGEAILLVTHPKITGCPAVASISCKGCKRDYFSDWKANQDTIIEAWNTRASLGDCRALREAAKKLVKRCEYDLERRAPYPLGPYGREEKNWDALEGLKAALEGGAVVEAGEAS